MRLNELVIRNFRGFPANEETVFDLNHSVVLLYGKNGMGKTSTLDAIELATTGAIRRFSKYDDAAISRSLINADSPDIPATVRVTGRNGQIRVGEARIAAGSNCTSKPLLETGERSAFDSTSYLTQSEIRRIVTLDSASLGQLVRSLVADERIDTVIEGLAGANINRQNRTYQSLKKRFQEYEESITRLSTELETKEGLFKSVQPSANAMPHLIAEIVDLATTMQVTTDLLKDAASGEKALRAINFKIQTELREALNAKSTADENIRLCVQLESEQKMVNDLTERLASLSSAISKDREEISRLKGALKQETEKFEDSRKKLTEQESFRALLDTLIASKKLLDEDVCPVCDRPFSNLKSHVEKKRTSLLAGRSELLKIYEAQEIAQRNLRNATSSAENKLLESVEEHGSAERRLLSIQKTRATILDQIGGHDGDLSLTIKREEERKKHATDAVERLTGLSSRSKELLGSLSTVIIQHSDTIRTIDVLKTRKSSQEKQLEAARAKKEQLESFIDNIQKLRKRLEEQAEELLRAFTLVDAQRVFSDLFNRLARNPLFQVSFTEAKVLNHKPRVDWKAMRNSGAYDGELIFSQGELNASALAMFLALASTYKNHLKLLILDDPIQSMDEVHIEELGEVLKAFKDELDWQIVISLHDEAAFKYFRRQLSPSAHGQSLASFILERSENRIRVSSDRPRVFDEKVFEVAAG